MKGITMLFLLVPYAGLTQQHHYWNAQYGARSSLLGGAVIAGVNDNSAIYYNPAALTEATNASISLNANAYEVSWFNMKDGLGQGYDLEARSFDLYPQFASGSINFKNPKLKMGYALLTRDYTYLKMDERFVTFTDAIVGLPGNEEFIGSFEYLNRVNEQWAALAVGYQLSPKLSIGLTQFFGYRSHTSRATFTSEAVTSIPGNPFYIARVRQHEDISYDNIKAIWKLGILLNLEHWKIGLTVTSPSVNINPAGYSTGTVRREFSVENLNVFLPDTLYPTFLASDKQEDIKSLYKYPLSVGLGIEYSTPKIKVSISAEYFSEIAKYRVLSGQLRSIFRPSNVLQNLATDEFVSVVNHSKQIVNVAVGLEQVITPKWSLLAGFRTDVNAFDYDVAIAGATSPIGEIVTEPTYWDLYHFSLGVSINRKRNKMTIGLNYYTNFSPNARQYSNYDNPKDFNFFEGEVNNNARTTSTGLRLIIGYTHYLKSE
ncbi:hypothetical protein BKI52_28475 [marine bacterium AO1-C]|nr:hypothetical protein BKI52_28475 [marine bacterium AO1-C]